MIIFFTIRPSWNYEKITTRKLLGFSHVIMVGSGEWLPYLKGYWRDPFLTSMIMGGSVSQHIFRECKKDQKDNRDDLTSGILFSTIWRSSHTNICCTTSFMSPDASKRKALYLWSSMMSKPNTWLCSTRVGKHCLNKMCAAAKISTWWTCWCKLEIRSKTAGVLVRNFDGFCSSTIKNRMTLGC